MKLKHLFLIALLFITGMVSAQQMGPIPVNKNVRQGKLSNGLTYYILHNDWPEHVANFYIAQRVGSIQENENQRGLAHFLEHMAFNGSEHFPDSTLLEFTRSLGVEFGSNLNAYTSIDQTVYRVCDVPTTRQTALDSCLLILKDWSNGLTLADKEIDKNSSFARINSVAVKPCWCTRCASLYNAASVSRSLPSFALASMLKASFVLESM